MVQLKTPKGTVFSGNSCWRWKPEANKSIGVLGDRTPAFRVEVKATCRPESGHFLFLPIAANKPVLTIKITHTTLLKQTK